LSIKRTIFQIFAFKNFHDVETGVLGHSRSSKMVPVDTAYATFYSPFLVTMAVSRAVCERA